MFFSRPAPQPPPPEERRVLTLGDQSLAYILERSARRKRSFALGLESEGVLRILVPARFSDKHVLKILEQHKSWIFARAAKRQSTPRIVKEPFNPESTRILFRGHACVLVLTRETQAPSSCRLYTRRFVINIPDTALSEEALRAEVQCELALFFKKHARVKIRQRMDLWAARMGVAYSKLTLNDAQTRWGSCSPDDSIRLNWRLMTAPLDLLDYVIVHELCHTRHKNHSARFWSMVGRFLPDYEERRTRLRQKARLYTQF